MNIEQQMEAEAEFGLFFAYLKITKTKADELRRKGLNVTDSKESKKFPRLHRIAWENSHVDGNVYNLDERDIKYSLSQKLWIISMKSLPTC